MWMSVTASKMPNVPFLDQARASISSCKNFIFFISFKTVAYISFAVECVFPKDLEPMLIK